MGSDTKFVARITFGAVVLAGFSFLLKTAESRTTIPLHLQGKNRLVTKKPWRVEPVKVVSATSKRKEKIELGKPFDDEDDWLDGFTVTVSNDSDKTVTAVVVEMVFPREPGDTRNEFGEELSLGPSPITPEYNTRRDPNRVIKPGETADLKVRPDTYKSIKEALQTLGYPASINRVEIIITEVGFDDGSVLMSGKLYLQDPANPSDPTKKIPADKPKKQGRYDHHRDRSLQTRKSHFLRKASGPNGPIQEEECWDTTLGEPYNCPPQFPIELRDDCYVRVDYLSLHNYGDYGFVLRTEHCRRGTPEGFVDCNLTRDVARYVPCCHALYCEDSEAIAANSC